MKKSREKLPAKSGLLHRPRIDKLLDIGLGHPIVVVVAGVGYGKTQAVASYATGLERRLVWLRLASLDCHVRRFWESLIGAFSDEMPQLVSSLSNLDFPDTVEKFDAFLRILTKELYAGEPVVFVVDDYHCAASNGQIGLFFKGLLEAELENLCVVIVSSERSSVATNSLRSGSIFSITGDDLRFTKDEISCLFMQNGTGFTTAELGKIVDETEGWPLALHLLCMQHRKTGQNLAEIRQHLRIVSDFFEKGFYEEYEESLQRLLVRLSICPSFTGEMVRELDEGDFQRTIHLLHRHMFISFDHTLRIYIFHKMYRQFLSSRQSLLSGEERLRVCELAGDSAFARGDFFDAIGHYSRAGAHDAMMRALTRIPTVRKRVGLSNHLLECLDRIPKDYPDYRMVLFCKAFLHLNNMDTKRARALFEQLYDQLEEQVNEGDSAALLGEVCLALGDISLLENNDRFCRYFTRAQALLPQGSWIRDPRLMYVGNGSIFFLPDNSRGSMDAVVGKMMACAPRVEAVANGCAHGLELLFAAEAAFASYRIESAEQYSLQAIYKARGKGQYDIQCNAHFILARAAILSGNFVRARQNVQRVVSCIDGNDLVHLYGLRDFIESWFYLKLEDSKKASKWVLNDEEMGEGLPYGAGRDRLIRAFYMMARGRYPEASAILSQTEEPLAQRGFWSNRLMADIMLARCQFVLGDRRRAMELLGRAYERCFANGIVTPFVECGQGMCELLDFAKNSPEIVLDPEWVEDVYRKSADYASKLALVRAQYRRKERGGKAQKDKFTGREQEVLTYLAWGLNREDIAGNMHISVNGVKRHITNIYNKLGAINRADAIRIAIGEGYLK